MRTKSKVRKDEKGKYYGICGSDIAEVSLSGLPRLSVFSLTRKLGVYKIKTMKQKEGISCQ